MIRTQLLSLAMLVVVASSSTTAFADDADRLFDQGLAAYKEGKLDVALASYQSAWKLRRTQDLAASMAQVELLLGRHRDAAEHLSYALRYFPVSGKRELRDKLEAALAESKTKVTTVRVRLEGGAESPAIRVDGAAVDAALTGPELFITPGAHTIEASAKGYAPTRKTIEAKAGDSLDVVLMLTPVEQPAERSMVPVAIAFGGGGVALVTGVVAAGVAAAKTDDLKKLCGDPIRCPPTERGNLDAATAAAHVSTVGFVLAGVGAVAGAILWLVPGRSAEKPQSTVLLGPGFLGVKGSF